MQVRCETTVRVPGGTRLGLTDEQLQSRINRVFVTDADEDDSVKQEGTGPDFRLYCTARDTLEFKAGEVIEVIDVPEAELGKRLGGTVTVIDSDLKAEAETETGKRRQKKVPD
jgi:hypothetical protein